MKLFVRFFSFALLFLIMAGTAAQAQDKPKGWSRKAKGAAIGGGGGAALGAVVGGGKGALIGAAAGVVAGGAVGRAQDKKKDPARYNHYTNKPSKRVPL